MNNYEHIMNKNNYGNHFLDSKLYFERPVVDIEHVIIVWEARIIQLDHKVRFLFRGFVHSQLTDTSYSWSRS